MDHDYLKKPVANKSRNTKYCCVPQCSTYGDTGISFHLFPKDKIMKKKWKTALRIGKPISPSMRVCSHHFQTSNFFPGSKYIYVFFISFYINYIYKYFISYSFTLRQGEFLVR